MPAVSVIIPVYRAEKYIGQCARSLFGQTMGDLEFIFVDDCSPDASMEILDRVLDEYPERRGQVKVLRNDVNRGQAYARRIGVEAATGEYIIHCDSDDWVETDMYGKLYKKASSENLDMVICRLCRVLPDLTKVPGTDIMGLDDVLGALIRQDIFDYLVNKLISRKAYDKGIIYPVCNMSEDSAMVIQLACNCDSFGYVDEILYNYRVTEGSISYSLDSVEKIDQMRRNFDLAFSVLEEKGLAGRYKDDIMSLKCRVKFLASNLPRRFYVNLYPEADLPFLFDRKYTVMQRLGHLTRLLGIHGISKPFRRKKG